MSNPVSNRSNYVVGTVKGPGESGNQYVFITSDNRHAKIGEYVYYDVREDGRDRQILGKISALRLIDHLPDRLFADPEISPQAVATMIGLTHKQPEIYEVGVEVIGYFDRALGFMNPRKSPDPGARVFLADDQMLQQALNRKQPGDVGSAEIGSLLLREPGAVPVALDVKELVSTHMAILAGTGSGKSYTAGVLIEELLRPYNRAAVLILDPHGEYGTLDEIQGHPKFAGDDGYAPQVRVISPDEIRIRMSSLDYYDLLTLLPQMSERQQAILDKGFQILRKHRSGHRWNANDLIAAVQEADTKTDDEGNETVGSSAQALEWKLQKLDRSPYFHAFEHSIAPRELFEPGKVTILQMNEISQEEQQVICTAVLRSANQARMGTHRGQFDEMDENYLPFPVFILLEEAHRFAPAHEPSRCKQVLRTILSEGRKFGIGIGLITQRPGKIDADVLSQCMSQFIMRIINPVDQESLKHGVEAAGRDLLKELPSLTKGQVIVSGACVNSPVLCKVRTRLTKHGGETLNAPALWQQHFQGHQVQARKIEDAPVAMPKKVVRSARGRSVD
jgi:uncharacterized protein